MKLRLTLLLLVLPLSLKSWAGTVDNEIIILMDGSGSVYDSDYARWLGMISLANQIVSDTETGNAHAIGIASGCSASYNATTCADQGRLNMHWGLHDGAVDPLTGNPIPGSQGPGDVGTFVSGLGTADFPGGYSWHDEALGMALDSFAGSSNTVTNSRHLFFLTDGQGPTSGHEPLTVDPGTGAVDYQSAALVALRDLGVQITAVIFEGPATVEYDYLLGLVDSPDHLFSSSDFDDVSSIVTPAVGTPAPASLLLMLLGVAVLAGLRTGRR